MKALLLIIFILAGVPALAGDCEHQCSELRGYWGYELCLTSCKNERQFGLNPESLYSASIIDRSFMVEERIEDPDCKAKDPWQQAFKELFIKLRKNADEICKAYNVKARLERNIAFECKNSILTGVQAFTCRSSDMPDCSYGKCCPGGICE